MHSHLIRAAAAVGLTIVAFTLTAPAQAQTALQQCSSKYQAAKAANTLNGQGWTQFRAACLQEVRNQPATAPTAAAQAPANPLRTTPSAQTTAAASAAPATAAARTVPGPTNATFPRAVDPKYTSETAARQRFKTCLDQCNVNKKTNGNGGLKWLAKAGYYSQCNTRLKA